MYNSSHKYSPLFELFHILSHYNPNLKVFLLVFYVKDQYQIEHNFEVGGGGCYMVIKNHL